MIKYVAEIGVNHLGDPKLCISSIKLSEDDEIKDLQNEVNKKSAIEDKFNQDIEELSQETESLVSEIEKWKM